MGTSETCKGVAQCQKDAAINEAKRATLGEIGGVAQSAPYAAEKLREYQRIMEKQAAFACRHGIYGPQCPECPDGKTWVGVVASPVYAAQLAQSQTRTFTREEVLTVLKAKKAEITAMANPLEVLAHLVGIFERME